MAEHRGPEGATRRNMFLVDPANVVLIGTDAGTEKERKHPCYQHHNGRPITDEFVETFLRLGCIEPVSVWQDETERWCVVAGRRRTLAMREANRRLRLEGKDEMRMPCVPCVSVAKRGGEVDVADVKQVENAHRTGVSVMDSARDAARYQLAGHTVEQTASSFAVSGETIRNWNKLLALAPAVQQAIEAGKIAATDALKRCHGKDFEQQAKVLEGPKPRMGRPRAPSRATLRSLVISSPPKLSGDFLRGVKFCLGDLTAADVGIDPRTK